MTSAMVDSSECILMYASWQDIMEDDQAPALSSSFDAAEINEAEIIQTTLSESISLTSSMLGLYLSSMSDSSTSAALSSPLSSAPSSTSSSSSSFSTAPLSVNALTGQFNPPSISLSSVTSMNDIMANQLLEENVQIITLIRENLLNGNIKINYSLMRKFAANISRILSWYSPARLCS